MRILSAVNLLGALSVKAVSSNKSNLTFDLNMLTDDIWHFEMIFLLLFFFCFFF